MSSFCRAMPITALAALLLTPLARGQADKADAAAEKAREAAFAKQVNEAIDKGVKYLRGIQQGDGLYGTVEDQARSGAAALAGLALLESGVPADDAAVTRVADAVRAAAVQARYTYSVSTMILFLDRLGDPQDIPLIQALAVRLLAGQDRTARGGGWGYHTPAPDAAEVAQLVAVVKARKPWRPEKGNPAAAARKPLALKDLPRELRARIDLIYRSPSPSPPSLDLSNTQFAMIALWVARRYGIPTEYAFAATEHRLRRIQLENGAWSYQEVTGPAFGMPRATPQMTCAGLMGLAMAYAVNPKAVGVKRDLARDPAIQRGFAVLLPVIGIPKGVEAAPVLQANPLNNVYYTLWTLERMAVLFGAQRLGGKDWYRWGAEILLKNQQSDGSWHGAYERGGPDTCFALLFLKRTNLAPDLTVRIKKAPGALKLLEGITEGEKTKSDLGPAPRGPGGKQSRLVPQGSLPGSRSERLAEAAAARAGPGWSVGRRDPSMRDREPVAQLVEQRTSIGVPGSRGPR